jgi:hypothetical protein
MIYERKFSEQDNNEEIDLDKEKEAKYIKKLI